MTPEELDRFLQKTRQGILLTARADGSPDGVPVWFDWDGESVRFFSGTGAPKVDRIRADPRIAMLVCNDVDEAPAWVRFEGRAVIDLEADARSLAVDVLAPRYWDLEVPDYRRIVDQWAQAPSDAFVVVRFTPDRIASSAG
ncbi:MAG: pyridoxamine 5'-phosphate oxidase family protein [Actinomycetota bacterium]